MDLNEWLSRYSKTKIAFFAIFLGILLILYFNPLYDACDAQKEIFVQSQKDFIDLSPTDSNVIKKPSKWRKFMEYCRSTNTSGGCYELFSKARRFIDHLEAMPSKCFYKLKREPEVGELMFGLIKLMVFLVWGEFPPQDEYERFSWLKKEDVYLFCQLKERLKNDYPESWKGFELSLLKTLPGTEKISKKKIYELSLFSYSCDLDDFDE